VRLRPLPLLLLVAAAAATATVFAAAGPPTPPAPDVEVSSAPEASAAPSLVVDVQGAVSNPGVFRLPAGSRVSDALAAAGSTLADADPSGVNRAAPLQDGMRVYVPRVAELPPAGAVGTKAESAINLNRATAQQLTALPGIGPSTAERIIRAREKAPFRSVEELQLRGLVSARVLAEIQDLVTVR
jgi:competence protein ComEA